MSNESLNRDEYPKLYTSPPKAWSDPDSTFYLPNSDSFTGLAKVEGLLTGDQRQMHYDGFLTKEMYKNYWRSYFKRADSILRRRIHKKLRKRA